MGVAIKGHLSVIQYQFGETFQAVFHRGKTLHFLSLLVFRKKELKIRSCLCSIKKEFQMTLMKWVNFLQIRWKM